PAAHAAGLWRAVCVIGAWDIRLCAGRYGRENDVVVAAAGAGALLRQQSRTARTFRGTWSGDENERAKERAADAWHGQPRGGASAKRGHSLAGGGARPRCGKEAPAP